MAHTTTRGEAAWVNARRSASHPGSTRITSGDRVARAGHLIQTNHGRRWPRGDHFGSDCSVVRRPSRTWDRGCGVDLELILAFEQRRELSMRNDLDGSLNQPDDHQQNEKNGGRLAICAVRPANRSKKVVLGVRDRMGATDSGPVIDRRGARWRENWTPGSRRCIPRSPRSCALRMRPELHTSQVTRCRSAG